MKKAKVIIIAITSIVLFASCKKEKLIEMTTTSKTLHYGETYRIPATCENTITYSSANEWNAKVSSFGTVTARHIGNTYIYLKSEDNNRSFHIIVEARSNLYYEPNIHLKWTEAHVKQTLGEPLSTTPNAWLYNYTGIYTPFLMVCFENYWVSSYVVLVDYRMKFEIDKYLEERYEYIGNSSSGYEMYIDALTVADANAIVAIDLFSYEGANYWMICYLPNESKQNTSTERIKKQLEQCFQLKKYPVSSTN